MKPSRATQPFRKGVVRQPGLALKAMKRGRTSTGFNPMDVQRALAKGGNASRKVAAPVAPAGPVKGMAAKASSSKPASTSAFQLHRNSTGNARDGQTFRRVQGRSKSGVAGEFHVYAGGRRVFVPSKRSKMAAKVQRAR